MKWKSGHDPADTGDNYVGVGSTTSDGWCCLAQNVGMKPGYQTITKVGMRRALAATVQTDAYVVAFEYDSGTGACTVLGRQAVTTTASDTESAQNHDVNIPILVGSLPVYVGIFYDRRSSLSNRPGARGIVAATQRPTASSGSAPSVLRITIPVTAGVDLPASWTNGSSSVVISGHASNVVYCEWQSINGVMAELPAYSGTAVGYSLPRPVDGRSFLLFRDVVVTDGNALTLDFRDGTASDGTVVIDMGATDQITVDGVSVALPAINSLAQAGDTFDIAIGMEPNGGGIDVYWVNRTKGAGGGDTGGTYSYRDITTISHTCADATAARGAVAAINHMETLYISGTASYSAAYVLDASKLFIALGDSQTGTKTDSATASALTSLGSAFASIVDGQLWNAGISGGRFDSDVTVSSVLVTTAGKTRYSGTIGTHDLVEMVDKSGATLLYMGMGINDISAGVSNDATAISVPAAIAASLEPLIADTGNGSAVLFGLPPYSADPAASAFDSTAVRNLNDQLFSLATEYSLGFVSPWAAMWDGTINANGAYVFNTDYTDDDLHYNTTGADIAAALLEDAVGGERSNAGNARGGPRTRTRTRTRQC